MRFEFDGYSHIAKGEEVIRGGVIFVSDGEGKLVAEVEATEEQEKALVLGYGATKVEAKKASKQKKARTQKAKTKRQSIETEVQKESEE